MGGLRGSVGHFWGVVAWLGAILVFDCAYNGDRSEGRDSFFFFFGFGLAGWLASPSREMMRALDLVERFVCGGACGGM